MRIASPLLALVAGGLLGCGGGQSGDTDTDTDTDTDDIPDIDAGPTNTLTITTPDITIPHGTEQTYCYFFEMPNTTDVAVKRWASQMSGGSHHLILYFTDDDSIEPGTLTPNCDTQAISDRWTYSAQTAENSAAMPAGVGMGVPAGQRAYVQLHYLNAGDADVVANATLTAELFPDGEEFIPAAAYITYAQGFSLPNAQATTVEHTCAVPGDAKFFGMSTHTHKRSTATAVLDGESTLLTSDDWEHPTVVSWDEPFYSFESGALTYHCEYFNDTGGPIDEGASAQTNEMCMAVGYFFPADEPVLCVNNFVIP